MTIVSFRSEDPQNPVYSIRISASLKQNTVMIIQARDRKNFKILQDIFSSHAAFENEINPKGCTIRISHLLYHQVGDNIVYDRNNPFLSALELLKTHHINPRYLDKIITSFPGGYDDNYRINLLNHQCPTSQASTADSSLQKNSIFTAPDHVNSQASADAEAFVEISAFDDDFEEIKASEAIESELPYQQNKW